MKSQKPIALLSNDRLRYDGLTSKDRVILFNKFNKCSICKGKSYSSRLVVDHCHRTGYVRGVLCERCNSWLGILEGKGTQERKESFLKKINKKSGIPIWVYKSYLKSASNKLFLFKLEDENKEVMQKFTKNGPPIISVEI